MVTIAALISYPVKSCAGISFPATYLTDAGLAHDRIFMVTGPDGTFRSQRRDPRLALITPAIDERGRWLTLRAEGMDPIRIEVDLSGPRRPVALFGIGYQGIDQGERAARWISRVIGADSRLVRVPPEHHRVTDGLTAGTSCFADSCPVHMISAESLADLNSMITGDGNIAVPMNRFRPNIVVDGWLEPYLEDRAQRIAIASAEIGFAKPAIRCVTTRVDQHTGTRSTAEPLRTLATYRRTDGGVAFGAKFAVLRPGKLTVGDECVVTDWQPACLSTDPAHVER